MNSFYALSARFLTLAERKRIWYHFGGYLFDTYSFSLKKASLRILRTWSTQNIDIKPFRKDAYDTTLTTRFLSLFLPITFLFLPFKVLFIYLFWQSGKQNLTWDLMPEAQRWCNTTTSSSSTLWSSNTAIEKLILFLFQCRFSLRKNVKRHTKQQRK